MQETPHWVRCTCGLAHCPSAAAVFGRRLCRRTGVFTLVVLTTFPVIVPFFFISNAALAIRASNLLVIGMLFDGGCALGH